MRTITCRDCQVVFPAPTTRGKPPVRCPTCKAQKLIAPPPAVISVAASLTPMPPSLTVKVSERESAKLTEETTDKTPTIAKPNDLFLGSFPFEVHVTNAGFLHRGESNKDAKREYERWSNASLRGFGQVGGEIVSLYEKGELVQRFDPREYKKGEVI